jgi:hypothetical protein
MPTELPPKQPARKVPLRKLFVALMGAKFRRWKRQLVRIIRRQAGR